MQTDKIYIVFVKFTLNKIEMNFDELCRACLQFCETMKPIFTYQPFVPEAAAQDDVQSVSDLLANVFNNIEFFENDGLPNKICLNCLDEIMRAYSFKFNYEKNQRILKKFKEIKIDSNDSTLNISNNENSFQTKSSHITSDESFFIKDEEEIDRLIDTSMDYDNINAKKSCQFELKEEEETETELQVVEIDEDPSEIVLFSEIVYVDQPQNECTVQHDLGNVYTKQPEISDSDVLTDEIESNDIECEENDRILSFEDASDEQNIRMCESIKEFNCELCSASFQFKHELSSHKINSHLQTLNNQIKRRTKIILKAMRSKHYPLARKTTSRIPARTISSSNNCDLCFAKFTCKEYVLYHKKISHGEM